MSIAIALTPTPAPTEKRHRSTLTGVLPASFPSTPKADSTPKPHSTPVSDQHAKGLEAVHAARATLARMLGALELFALSVPDEQDLHDVRQDAASIATNLCEITAAFVAVATQEEPAREPTEVARWGTPRRSDGRSRDARARLEQLCSFPATTMAGYLLETSVALNKMAGAFMRVAGCLDLDASDAHGAYDPDADIRAFPRLLTEATAALQAGDYELGLIRSHQRLLAAVLAAIGHHPAVQSAMVGCGELGPLRSFLEETSDAAIGPEGAPR